jgi:hypothetical protein
VRVVGVGGGAAGDRVRGEAVGADGVGVRAGPGGDGGACSLVEHLEDVANGIVLVLLQVGPDGAPVVVMGEVLEGEVVVVELDVADGGVLTAGG